MHFIYEQASCTHWHPGRCSDPTDNHHTSIDSSLYALHADMHMGSHLSAPGLLSGGLHMVENIENLHVFTHLLWILLMYMHAFFAYTSCTINLWSPGMQHLPRSCGQHTAPTHMTMEQVFITLPWILLINMCAFCAQASSTHQCGSNDIRHLLRSRVYHTECMVFANIKSRVYQCRGWWTS